METRRICPKCRKKFPPDAIVCEECGKQLIDVTSDFEASFQMVRDPVLLSNGHKVDTVYLEEALKERNIPYYVEKGQNTVPTNRYKEGIVEIVPYTNYYVDKSNWKTAREALKNAAQETKKDEEAPVVFLDMPMEEPQDAPRDMSRDTSKKTSRNTSMGASKNVSNDDWADSEEDGGRGLWGWVTEQDMAMKVILAGVILLFLLGLFKIILF
ncbi:Uncharacterised protein [uncultured Clostridium sp.]|nr:Uncharacterised protein [uncultured Clostridium sp.]